MAVAAPDFRLQGLRVPVTGASRGIGRAVALTTAAAGATEPEDIAGPVVFLRGAAACGITGIALPVDGGVTAE